MALIVPLRIDSVQSSCCCSCRRLHWPSSTCLVCCFGQMAVESEIVLFVRHAAHHSAHHFARDRLLLGFRCFGGGAPRQPTTPSNTTPRTPLTHVQDQTHTYAVRRVSHHVCADALGHTRKKPPTIVVVGGSGRHQQHKFYVAKLFVGILCVLWANDGKGAVEGNGCRAFVPQHKPLPLHRLLTPIISCPQHKHNDHATISS